MNILHINQSESSGGAAIAGFRLHQKLLSRGIASRLLVGSNSIDSPFVNTVPEKSCLETNLGKVTRSIGLHHINIINTFQILNHRFYIQADIINLHNLHTGYFNYLALPTLTRDKPAVFTLHDMWSFTGHCAYSYGCNRWQSGCGECPYLDSYPAIRRDGTHQEWVLKRWVYKHSKLTIVTLSNWLKEQVQKSILKYYPVHHIPNGIDTQKYKPLDSKYCRSLLDIDIDKRVLMFAADNLKDPRKGGTLLKKALSNLPQLMKENTVLLTIGHCSENISEAVGMKVRSLGYVSDDSLKTIAFSAADLFVFPTLADNLPLVLQESMSCGTPLVSFDVGGVPDLVRPGITGYLAKPGNVDDFCNGIVQVLNNDEMLKQMRYNCREIALNEYSLELQGQRYINLYSQLLDS
jgi:glycosyltransferase involved in cell wall biosynthesis